MDSYLIIILAVIFCAFFSGMEIAFVTSNKLRLELDIKQGSFGSGILKIFSSNPGQYIATMIIGENICLVIYSIIISDLLTSFFSPVIGSDSIILIVNTLISTGLILIVADFLPKAIFRLSPNFFLKIFSVITFIFYIIFYPISKATLFISDLLIRLLPGCTSEKKVGNRNIVFSKADLDHFVSINNLESIMNETERDNIKIFQNALDFSNVKVRECMIPRTEIEAVEINSSIETLKEKFIATRYSRILVYSETIDQVAGYFELKDIFKNPSDIKSGLRKLAIVPETMPASNLLKQFVDEGINIAVVVDEFGGTSGMVTIEDILEEIVGDIQDEHDTNELIEKQVSSNEFIFSGRLEIDYLNEKYKLGLPEADDYETLAGLVLYYHGSIPQQNDIIRINNFVIKILRTTATRIDIVSLRLDQ